MAKAIDRVAAKAAGYSDAEIDDFMKQFNTASGSGSEAGNATSYLSQPAPTPSPIQESVTATQETVTPQGISFSESGELIDPKNPFGSSSPQVIKNPITGKDFSLPTPTPSSSMMPMNIDWSKIKISPQGTLVPSSTGLSLAGGKK